MYSVNESKKKSVTVITSARKKAARSGLVKRDEKGNLPVPCSTSATFVIKLADSA